ncbi:transposase [Serratia ureilytica]|uniref:transposase n=1 Tax=Serratia ureilytica TaxID=300181 RepID=UPI0021C4B331|nr:transposase [Serratia ureilytica]
MTDENGAERPVVRPERARGTKTLGKLVQTVPGKWNKGVATLRRETEGYAGGIIASARHRLNTSVLEGMNNKIKVMKRMAYGYRDNAYFFLKIKAAFPGKAR